MSTHDICVCWIELRFYNLVNGHVELVSLPNHSFPRQVQFSKLLTRVCVHSFPRK